MRNYAVVIMIAASILLCSQIESDIIVWNEKCKLKFSDFEGSNNDEEDNGLLASSNLGINDYYVFTDTLAEYNITSEFSKQLSWMKLKDSNLLEHEQLHFDIYELYARKMRSIFYHINIKRIEDTIYILRTQVDFVQLRYDKETNHGAIFEKQRRWHENIIDSLRLYKKYSSASGRIIKD